MEHSATPLSHAQRGVYIDCILHPEKLNYNIPYSLTFSNLVSPQKLADATARVLACHPSLFSVFENREDEVVQVYNNERPIAVDIQNVTDDAVSAAKTTFVRNFDIEQGPLFRAVVLAAPTSTILLIDIHHLVCDGTSMNLLLHEICDALEGNDPAEEQHDYAAFVEAQQNDTCNHKAYYDQLLADVEPTSLPADLNGGDGGHKEVVWQVSADNVMERAKAMGTAPSALFMSAAFYTVARYANSKSVCMTTISNGRTNPLTKGVVGMFVNTLALVSRLEDLSVKEYILKTREMFVETRQHEEYPFANLVNDYGIEQKVRFTYQYGTYKPLLTDGQEVKRERLRTNDHEHPFTVTINEVDGKPAIIINYDSALYSEVMIRRFAESMDAVVSHFIDHPEARLLSVSIMSAAQAEELGGLRQTCIDPDAVRFPLFHNSVEYWAEHTPDKTAVIACDETLTYRQLNEKANILAHALIDKGVVPGDRICLLLPRKSWHLIAMFGVMKAGAAYIPCDPEYPAERINLITEDSHARYVITTEDKMAPYGTRALNVEELLAIVPDDSIVRSNPNINQESDSLAYLIYTSGSTGRPKGVMLHHRGICNYLTPHKENRHIHAFVNECQMMMGLTTVSFDLSLKELGATLYNGKTLVFANEEEVMSPILMTELFKRTGCDGFNGTPSRLKMFLEWHDFADVIKNVKVIILGGEKYPATLIEQLRSLTNARLFNTYGPTEITVSSNVGELTHEDKVTVGEPLLNYQEFVVDADDNELPVGVVGELLIGGLAVGRGYNDLQEKTAEAFIEYQGQRVYRSGDYARWLPDGKVEILGRKDHQIKLNGLRIELGEVETVLNRQPQVKEGVVMIRNVNGHDHLVAYYTTHENVDESTLKEQMATSLTDYMVPTVFMPMDKMPISPNGKTDLKALPVPVMKDESTDDTAPRELNFLEKKLTRLVGGILDSDNVSVASPLRRCGLTSLLAIKLATHLYKEFGVKFKVKELSAGNILDIEETILESVFAEKSEKEDKESATGNATTPQVPARMSPLSYPQQGVYLDIMRNPESVQYNMPKCLEFPAEYSSEAIAEAVRQMIRNHPILSAHFESDGETVMQVMPETVVPEVTISTDDIEQLKADFIRPFDLEHGPLYRATVVGSALLFDVLHLVNDGFSNGILINDICKALEGKRLTPEAYTYVDYVADEQKARESREFAESKTFFAERMKTIDEASSIQADVNRGEGYKGNLGYASTPVDKNAINAFAQRLGITPAALCLAAVNYTVARYTNSKDVCIATISNGRSNVLTSDTVGMFVNTLPLTAHLKDQTVEQFILDTADEYEQTLEHENYPFAELSAEYDLHPDVLYLYQIGVGVAPMVGGKKVKRSVIGIIDPKFKMTVSIEEDEMGQERIEMKFNDAFYSHELAQRLSQSVAKVLHNMMADPSAPIRKVTMLDADDLRQLASIRQTCIDPGAVRFPLFHNSVEYWAEQTPDKTAVIACNETLTYRQLNEKANILAHALIDKGVVPGDRICLLLPRKSWHLIAMFGVMKAGAAYIPCDPEYPAERINLITEDSHARYVITTEDKMAPYGTRALNVEELLAIVPDDSIVRSNPNIDQESDSLAYLIYTSGSTGRPKGVMLRHIGICNYLTAHEENRHFHALVHDCKTMLCITTVSFDLSLKEIGASLFNGMTLVFANEDQVNDPLALADLMKATGVDGFSGTPSRLKMFLDLPDFQQAFANCRFIVLGGEKYPPTLLPLVKALAPEARLFNTYGPTEISVSCNGKELTHAEGITIGRPLLNVKEYVVDDDLNELPVGVTGELLIGGLGVSAGYNNLPEKTAEAFIDYNGERCYKSGDYAYWNAEGDVIILGRKDHQIKLNGLRIELGEVETILNKQPQVKEGVVMIKNVEKHDHLVAYFVANDNATVGDVPTSSPTTVPEDLSSVLKEQMGKSLTHYMVPTIFVQLDKMPISPNGKTDLKSLPEPTLAEREYVEPQNDVERFFCDIFAEILERDRVGATDNFFEIGGTSLVAMRVVMKAVKQGYQIVYKDVFECPTPRALAKALTQNIPHDPSPALPNEGIALQSGEGRSKGHEECPYDYSAIDALLQSNVIANIPSADVTDNLRQLGVCVVTGATGYLGIHILKELIDRDDVPAIYCLVRGGKSMSAKSRLRTQLFYYFGDSYDSLFDKRIFVIDGDVTKTDWHDHIPCPQTQPLTLFNCAANVKHFSAGTDIEDINIGGCQSCIDFCLKTGARLIQTSTHSIEGRMISDSPVESKTLKESTLYMGQTQSGQYTQSKFVAERNVLEAVATKGLDAKIMRYGNLAARSTDGEFQINFSSNGFMNRLNVYKTLGAIPYSKSASLTEFSPINEVAHATVLLAMTPKQFTVFMPINSHHEPLSDVIVCMRRLGYRIDDVEQEVFDNIVMEAGQDPQKAALIQSLLAYAPNIRGKHLALNKTDNSFTTQMLMRLGFGWSFTTWDYIERMITAIEGLGFFDDDYQR